MQPTKAQRFYASAWPEFIGFNGIALIVVILCLRSTGFRPSLLLEWPTNIWFVVVTLISALLGIFLAAIPGMLLMGPLFYHRSVVNGAPFEVGDRVQIIGGKYDGTVTHIYSTWQGNAVRVDLGEQAKTSYRDVFGPTQLLRVSNGR